MTIKRAGTGEVLLTVYLDYSQPHWQRLPAKQHRKMGNWREITIFEECVLFNSSQEPEPSIARTRNLIGDPTTISYLMIAAIIRLGWTN